MEAADADNDTTLAIKTARHFHLFNKVINEFMAIYWNYCGPEIFTALPV